MGTVGSPECGDMLRMWLKFTEKDGKRVIDRASFQAFGCQTAIAVASMATELLRGKTAEEAKHLTVQELTGDLGPLPPMKIHCGQLVEGALRNALDNDAPAVPLPGNMAPILAAALHRPAAGKLRGMNRGHGTSWLGEQGGFGGECRQFDTAQTPRYRFFVNP